MKRLILLFSVLLSSVSYAEPLVIKTQKGSVALDVEIAKDLAKGLMFRTHLEPKSGMLFLYPEPHVARMWMKNTLIPLDMLFIDTNGRIVHIHENARPKSLRIISAPMPVKAVIEIGGGEARRLGIHSGDKVTNLDSLK